MEFIISYDSQHNHPYIDIPEVTFSGKEIIGINECLVHQSDAYYNRYICHFKKTDSFDIWKLKQQGKIFSFFLETNCSPDTKRNKGTTS